MTKKSVAALAFGFVAFILSALPIATASAQPACESGHRYDPQTRTCKKIKMMGKKKLPNAGTGGAGGGDCYPGYTYDARRGGCVLYQDGRVIQFF